MTPVMGQGLNCGLEDVAVFANMLQQHKGNVATTLPAYSKARGPDVEGILSVNELMTDRSIFVPIQVCLSGLNAEAYTHAHVGLCCMHNTIFRQRILFVMVRGCSCSNTNMPSFYAEAKPYICYAQDGHSGIFLCQQLALCCWFCKTCLPALHCITSYTVRSNKS